MDRQQIRKLRPSEAWLTRKVLAWFQVHARDLPWRRTTDPYAIWVSEIMLQQTQVKTVIPYFERWMRELPSVRALAEASSQTIHKLWEGLGYYTRVRNMQRSARLIIDQHGGRFPRSHEEVLALPGIGPYTAGAICSIAFNDAAPIVDGNVVRFFTRFFGIQEDARSGPTREQLWTLAQKLVNHAARLDACSRLNQGLMEIGAMVCTPRAPGCDACPCRARCMAFARGWTEKLPNLGPRAKPTSRRFVAALVQRGSQVLVRQRPPGVVNAHLWEFPNAEVPLASGCDDVRATIERELGCGVRAVQPFARIKHSITRYRMTLDAVLVDLNGRRPGRAAGKWKELPELALLPFASAHGKIHAKWLSIRPVEGRF